MKNLLTMMTATILLMVTTMACMAGINYIWDPCWWPGVVIPVVLIISLIMEVHNYIIYIESIKDLEVK